MDRKRESERTQSKEMETKKGNITVAKCNSGSGWLVGVVGGTMFAWTQRDYPSD